MQMCPDCGYVYDEEDYARCPKCHKEQFGFLKRIRAIFKKRMRY